MEKHTLDLEKSPLHPELQSPAQALAPKSKINRKLLAAVAAAALYALALNLPPSAHLVSSDKVSGWFGNDKDQGFCRQPSPAAVPSNWSGLYEYEGFALESAKRLSGAIQIPTQSFDDMGPVESDPRWAPFILLRAYLLSTFPTVHLRSTLELVNAHSMVFTFPGSNSSLKPMMLTAHLDVVPATTSLDRWTHPPFDGVIDEEWIYGRGASDCKNNVIGILTSLEYMLNNGFAPTRTLLLAFGQDEEISGPSGATNVGIMLEERYGKDGIAMIVDEGGMGIETLYGVDFAKPGMSEKGFVNYKIEVDTLGGHSSVPSAHTSIGILGRITSAIEDAEIFAPRLELDSPILGYIQCLATYGKKGVPGWMRDTVKKGGEKGLKKLAERFAQGGLPDRYLIQTSKALTIFNGGMKVNALPESAVALFNSRVESYSTIEEVDEAYMSVILPLAKKYPLLVNGRQITSGTPVGNLTTIITAEAASPISPMGSVAFDVFAAAVQASFGREVKTAPSAMTGNTDTRHYINLSKHIYRWSPARIGSRLNAHTVDEKLAISAHVDGIKFYTELIVQADKSTDL